MHSWIQCFNFVFLTTARMGSAVDDRFVQIPTDQEPVEGDHFSVTCSSDAPTFIVWYKEGQIIPSTSHHFTQTSSAVGGTLSIDSVHHDLHTGLYECVAVFPDSFTASVAFSITVKYIDADVEIQLEAGSNCSAGYELVAGCVLRLECTPPDSYPSSVTVSWFRNDVELQQSLVDVSNNGRILHIGHVTCEDSGSYQCRVSNGIGITRNSDLINITVQGEGREFRFLENTKSTVLEADEGSTVCLTCSVVDAVGSVMFQWQADRDGDRVMVEGGRRVDITSTANSSSLLIHQATLMDEGSYYCVAKDYLSQIKQYFNVTIKVPRAIIQWPPSIVHSSEGDRARFDCIASGRPPPVVIWLFQSSLISATTLPGVQDLGNGSLIIAVLHQHHAGTYYCMLKDPPLDTHTFTLTVIARSHPSPMSTLPVLSFTPAGQNTHTNPFTIGPFSQVVSVCGLSLLLLCSTLLLVGLYCYCWLGKRLEKQHIQGQHGDPSPTKDYGLSEVVRESMGLPLPPEVCCDVSKTAATGDKCTSGSIMIIS